VQLTLNLKGEFVQVVAVTARPEVAQIATAQVQQLVQALNQQGLVLSQFQVQIQDPSGRQPAAIASGQRDPGRRETESGDGGKTMSRRRAGQLDFFV
jgi:flagellar hook-length control protein FliK